MERFDTKNKQRNKEKKIQLRWYCVAWKLVFYSWHNSHTIFITWENVGFVSNEFLQRICHHFSRRGLHYVDDLEGDDVVPICLITTAQQNFRQRPQVHKNPQRDSRTKFEQEWIKTKIGKPTTRNNPIQINWLPSLSMNPFGSEAESQSTMFPKNPKR